MQALWKVKKIVEVQIGTDDAEDITTLGRDITRDYVIGLRSREGYVQCSAQQHVNVRRANQCKYFVEVKL